MQISSPGLDTSRRHPTLNRLETELTKVTHGDAARSCIATDGGVVLLPSVIWLPGPIDHAKSHRGLLPYPLTWDSSRVAVLSTDSRHTFRWSADAWGHHSEGELTVVCSPIAPSSAYFADLSDRDQIPDIVFLGVAPVARVERYLAGVVELADEARWSLYVELSGWLRNSMEAAHRAVAAEMKVRRCLDSDALDDLITTTELGIGSNAGLLARTVSRLADPRISRPGVDVVRFITVAFRRDAELALRRRLDDPRWVGAALREHARQHPELPMRELVESFNRSGRLAERVGVARAIRALRPAVQPEQVNLDENRSVTSDTTTALDLGTLAGVLCQRYKAHGGLPQVARRIVDETLDDCDESLAALRSFVRSRRLLNKLSTMTEEEASRRLAQELIAAGAS